MIEKYHIKKFIFSSFATVYEKPETVLSNLMTYIVRITLGELKEKR